MWKVNGQTPSDDKISHLPWARWTKKDIYGHYTTLTIDFVYNSATKILIETKLDLDLHVYSHMEFCRSWLKSLYPSRDTVWKLGVGVVSIDGHYLTDGSLDIKMETKFELDLYFNAMFFYQA